MKVTLNVVIMIFLPEIERKRTTGGAVFDLLFVKYCFIKILIMQMIAIKDNEILTAISV